MLKFANHKRILILGSVCKFINHRHCEGRWLSRVSAFLARIETQPEAIPVITEKCVQVQGRTARNDEEKVFCIHALDSCSGGLA